ncbi:hypothetical protein ATG98_0122 [Marinobacter sp. LV10R520-4]|uniref:O-antigen polymerase n=1 Tax=Marinobacter sp. LV10R520-4 TaxID=1761796 RepID=UPI000BF5D4BB|nr:O-antigen polymerase [Marinobacter sp. LV10R520-4]PFG51195.1 hypothetical protein ATG98_0122 [Marinobacter sp. LV10R520-4]
MPESSSFFKLRKSKLFVLVGVASTLLIQTAILVSKNASFQSHFLFGLLFFLIVFLVLFYLRRIWSGVTRDPLLIYSAFFLLNYYYSTLYMMVRHEDGSNRIFDYLPESTEIPVVICIIGYLAFYIGYSCLSFLNKKSLAARDYSVKQRNALSFSPYLFFSVGAFLAILKLYMLSVGMIGSVVGFSGKEGFGGNLVLSIFRPLVYLGPVFIAYFSIRVFRDGKYRVLLLAILFLEVSSSLIAGDRRYLLYYFIIVITIAYSYNFKISNNKFFFLSVIVFSVVVFSFGTALNNFINATSGHGNLNYVSVVRNVFGNATIFFNSEFFAWIVDNFFATFNQLYLIDSAHRIYEQGYTYPVPPILVYTANLLPFSKELGLDIITASELQYPLFKASLHTSGADPYLTLPQLAESYTASGYLGVVFYSFFYGILSFMIFKLSFRSSIYMLWYFSFYPFLSFGFIMSLSGALVFPLKVLVMLLFCSLVSIFLSQVSSSSKQIKQTN